MIRQPRDKILIERAKAARSAMSPPEAAMWKILRGHRLAGWKFTRQVPVDTYILDFAARRERLCIEVDGDSHADRNEYDELRTQKLQTLGWSVIRFLNSDILNNPDGVATAILVRLAEVFPSPQPSPRRGEGV